MNMFMHNIQRGNPHLTPRRLVPYHSILKVVLLRVQRRGGENIGANQGLMSMFTQTPLGGGARVELCVQVNSKKVTSTALHINIKTGQKKM